MSPRLKHLRWLTILSFLFVLIAPISSTAETVRYIYDDSNRLIRVEYGDGTVAVYVYDELGNRLQEVTYAGASEPPGLSVYPISYDFGSMVTWGPSSPQTFTISNTGKANLL